jgi:hypothetical protein
MLRGAHGKRILAAASGREAAGACYRGGRQYALWKVIEFAISVLPEPSRTRSLSGKKMEQKDCGAKLSH